MSDHELAGATALVTGASRGFGRGIATALNRAGAQVVGVARDRAALDELHAELGGSFIAVPADAADPIVAGQLIDAHRPAILVLNAGATPLPRPIHHHTWQTFSSNWDTDVQHVFNFTREALLAPLAPGSTVITLSSGAALRGSPLSGGYAGAKAAVRFITSYAAEESTRAGLGIRFVSLLPQLTPATALGSVYVSGLRRPAGWRRGPLGRNPRSGSHPGAGRSGGHQPGDRPRSRPGRLRAHRRGPSPAPPRGPAVTRRPGFR